jgi:glycosyltransferase involved in cell wall biosynthesis
MNVGVLFSNFSPDVGGGHTFENEVFDSLRRLAGECGHTFQVFVRRNKPSGLPMPANLNVVHLSCKRRFIERARAQLARCTRLTTRRGIRHWREGHRVDWLENVLIRSGVDVMWYPSPGAATTEIPFITVVWDLQHRLQPFFPEVSSEMEWTRRERSYGNVLRRATYVVTGTQVGKQEIERFYQIAPERIRILPHPTPQFAFQAPVEDERQMLTRMGVQAGYLFYPAQFWPHKNHVNLLRAVRLLRDEHGLSMPLVLVGSNKGNQAAHVRRMAADLGIESQVKLLGFVSQDELLVLYRNALALTYVTWFGPENLPPLEAFAAGCPVIASSVPGAEEQLGTAALMVDCGNPQTIARAVRSLHEDAELRKALIDQGHVRARRFQGDDFVHGVFEMLDEFARVRGCWSSYAA